MSDPPRSQVTITHLSRHRPAREELADDARKGLAATPKQLPPRHIYDARGSALFEQITELPEYYLTRTETGILERAAHEIIGRATPEELLELGSGSSRKTRLLLEAMHELGTGDRYLPLDVSVDALEDAAQALCRDYPWLDVAAYVGDFATELGRVPVGGRRLVTFLGSTIGNLLADERQQLLTHIRDSLTEHDRLLLGADLVKSPTLLVPAYDDDAGVTAAFTRNLLTVVNRELDGDIPVEAFTHVARWNAGEERMELSLRSAREVRGRLAAINLDVRFSASEELLVEYCCKFRVDGLRAELAAADFAVEAVWTDPLEWFALLLARPA